MEVRIASLILRFARPLETAYGALVERELVLLRLRGGDGVVGWGEAAPLEPYDGVPLEAVREALAVYEPILRDGDDLPGGALLDACRDAADLPQALAAVDLALWDRAGNREGRPVSALITDDPAASVRVNATIAAEDRAGAAAAAAAPARSSAAIVALTRTLAAGSSLMSSLTGRPSRLPARSHSARSTAASAWGRSAASRHASSSAPPGRSSPARRIGS